MDQRIVSYISRGRGAGVLDSELRQRLLAAGWPVETINQALAEAGSHVKIVVSSESLKNDEAPLFVDSSIHKFGFGLVIVVMVLMLVGAGVVFGYSRFQESRSPAAMLALTSESLQAMTSFSYFIHAEIGAAPYSLLGTTTSAVVLPTNVIHPVSTTTIDFRGVVSWPLAERPKMTIGGEIDSLENGSSTFRLLGGGRLIGETFYLYLAELSHIALIDSTNIVNRWVSITEADALDVGLPYSFQALSAGQSLALRQALGRTALISLINDGGKENINGVPTRHYGYTLNQEAVNDLVAEYGGSTLPLAFVGGDIWLGIGDGLPYKMTMLSADQSVVVTINLADYNKPVDITAPTTTVPLRQIAKDNPAS